MNGKLVLGFWILRWISLFGDPALAQKWPTSLDESLDERNDAEIFRAVVESMRQWTLHKKLHHRTKREVSKVCYEDVGCFEDTGPFSYLEMLPSPPKDVGTRFFVYGSRKARSIPMEVPAEDINDNAHRAIDPDLPTKVIVHGFGSGCEHVWVYEMRSALMSVQDCNIVCVDWGPGSAVPNYVRAAANTRLVGRQLAKLVRSLNVPLEKVHLIGFSLGAHVAGFAGAELGNVSRITGLDPAGPLFESQDPRARLDATDANFVDVIHSNGEQLLLGGLGSWQPMGDVDFYPNGGRMQTGCSNLFLGAVSDIIWSSAVEGRSLCNHRRAYKLFTDSVSPKCRFPAFSCDNGYDGLLKGDCFPCGVNGMDRPCGDMGYYSDESPARGQLYLITRDEEPFCAHQYQVKVYNSRSERPARSYGKLQVTVVGEGSFNDSFAMTKKDEELVVGSILQKIVVPHPAVNNMEAIEIKYTAYSGWISSGLVSWSIDKIAIVDSFGKAFSVCKKGLILESGRPVYLPLYSGECNIPQEVDNSTQSQAPPMLERMIQEKPGGIGPFTKEQNYDTKQDFPIEIFPKERTASNKGLGPFTKDQNLRIDKETQLKSTETFDASENRRMSSNPWSVIDISIDGDSNSLENTESERGRGFSDSNFVQRASSTPSTESTTEFLPEIHEPVLRLSKKETGRSLKLPEITEPILRPRAIRQNRNDVYPQDKRREEIQEASSTVRSFTVQFLPERLAGILAQAERYARQTLLPLISQYTPSFVSGARYDEPKYFPPLGDMSEEDISDSREIVEIEKSDRRTEFVKSETVDGKTLTSTEFAQINEDSTEEKQKSVESSIPKEVPVIIQAIYPEKSAATNSTGGVMKKESDWIPMGEISTTFNNNSSRRESNVSRALSWTSRNDYNWSLQPVNVSTDRKTDDWVPITVASDLVPSTTVQNMNVTEKVLSKEETTIKEDPKYPESLKKSATAHPVINNTNNRVRDERKFIPLVDISGPSDFFTSTGSNDILDSHSSSAVTSLNAQTISKLEETVSKADRSSTRRSMVFPYAYERRKDPRTRYIPLIPEEDMGRPHSFFERDR